MTRNIHAIRAQKWNVDPWTAEWIDNSVEYCKTPEGKNRLEEWVQAVYGAGARGKLEEIHCPPPARYVVRDPQELLYTRVAMDLGITPAAARLYCELTSCNNLVQPARNKPAPQRRKGETSEQWLARRNTALLQGSKIPDMRWQECRAIAFSQFDKTQDTIRLLRTDIMFLNETLMTRKASIIPSPEILLRGPMYVFFHTLDDAFRATVLLQMVSYAAWSQCAQLFEEFARRGLTTPKSIERAYKNDETLLWQITKATCALKELVRYHVGYLSQKITYSEHFRPYFKRFRVDGAAQIVRDDEYIKKHTNAIDHFDRVIIDAIATPHQNHVNTVLILETIKKGIKDDPSFPKRFSAEAFEALGDYAVADEMLVAMTHSTFGQEFMRQTSALQNKAGTGSIRSRIGYLRHPPPLPPVTYYDTFGTASAVYSSETNQWNGESIAEVTVMFGPECKYGEAVSLEVLVDPASFDKIWKRVDEQLWKAAKQCARPGEEGRIAKLFGLLDPADPNRPTLVTAFEQFTKDKELRLEQSVKSTPAPVKEPYAESIPTAISGVKDGAIISGHRYVQAESNTVKTKTKTNGSVGETSATEPETAPTGTPDLDTFPDALPQSYKLGRKVVKIFHRLLDGKYESDENQENVEKTDAPKKGQIRWNEFEKAMKRVGFTVIQTAGSSVRFDPPARTARPITFHRPHPDSLLTPLMVKIVGTRLAKCYGWSMKTFEVGMNSAD